jgi:hypothetical protein
LEAKFFPFSSSAPSISNPGLGIFDVPEDEDVDDLRYKNGYGPEKSEP